MLLNLEKNTRSNKFSGFKKKMMNTYRAPNKPTKHELTPVGPKRKLRVMKIFEQ